MLGAASTQIEKDALGRIQDMLQLTVIKFKSRELIRFMLNFVAPRYCEH